MSKTAQPEFDVLCRKGHAPIGYNERDDGDDECPLCATLEACENALLIQSQMDADDRDDSLCIQLRSAIRKARTQEA